MTWCVVAVALSMKLCSSVCKLHFLSGSVQAPPSKTRTSQAGIQRPMLVTLCDARWASCKDLSSQDGMLTVLCDAFVLKGEVSRFTPIAWQSRKLPRVTRPSTSAKVQMASTTIDNHEFTKQIMIHWFNPEMLPPGEVDSAMRQIESVMVSDFRTCTMLLIRLRVVGSTSRSH